MIMAVAALPPAAVDGDKSLPSAIIVAGCPILTYAPTIQRQAEQKADEMMVGFRRPQISMRAP